MGYTNGRWRYSTEKEQLVLMGDNKIVTYWKDDPDNNRKVLYHHDLKPDEDFVGAYYGVFRGFRVIHDVVKGETVNIRYEDTGEPYETVRECNGCQRDVSGDMVGPDPCLGRLPGVKNACCGHGIDGSAYIAFDNNTAVYGTIDSVNTRLRDKRLDNG